jgi:hypothetical protein
LGLYAIAVLGVKLDNRHESSVFERLKLRPAKETIRLCWHLNKSSFQNYIFNINPEENDNLNGAAKHNAS